MINKINFLVNYLRHSRKYKDVDLLYIPSADIFMLEQTVDSWNFFFFLTNFSSSNASILLDLKDSKHVILTDGRYLEAAKDIFSDFKVLNIVSENPLLSMENKKLILIKDLTKLTTYLRLKKGNKINLINSSFLWNLFNVQPGLSHFETFQIKQSTTSEQKILQIFNFYPSCECILVSDLYSCTWILNERSNLQPSANVLSKLLIFRDGRYIKVEHREAFSEKLLRGIRCVHIDKDLISVSDFKQIKKFTKIKYLNSQAIYRLQSIKDANEIEDMRIAHIEHGKALQRLISWMKRSENLEIEELSVANKLVEFCKESPSYLFNSFSSIVGFDSNSSVVHYRAGSKNKKLQQNSVALIDVGAQYKNGTTDVTRMIAFGSVSREFKLHYSLVLKAHVSLAMVKFPANTPVSSLDFKCRSELLKYGLNYPHSTGHGVGYLLNVHEYPSVSFGCKDVYLQPGNVVSIEPGLYLEDEYGIRIESLYHVRISENFKGMLEFEPLTKVTIDLSFLQMELFSEVELDWLKKYNSDCLMVTETEG